MTIPRFHPRWLALAAAFLVVVAVNAEEPQQSVVLKYPSHGGYVGMLDRVEGQVLRRGQPIVMVRPNQAGARWWVQEPALPTTPGHFRARAQFGNTETLDGAQFQVMVVFVTTAAQAAPFRVGASFDTLPLEIARSKTVIVTRGLPPAPGAVAPVNFAIAEDGPDAEAQVNQPPIIQQPLIGDGGAADPRPDDLADEVADEVAVGDRIVLSPAPMSEVDRIAELSGKAPIATHPVVLMRPNVDNTVWRVQDRPEVEDDGSFTSRLRCGNDRTAPGTEFRFVVLLPVTNQQVRGLYVGKVLKELPLGLQRSQEIVVKRK